MNKTELTEELVLALTELGVPVYAEGDALFVDGVRRSGGIRHLKQYRLFSPQALGNQPERRSSL